MPPVGSFVEATGICIVSENPDSDDLTRLEGLMLILRSEADLKVARLPPWWTPRRLSVVIAVLLVSIACISAWVVWLNRLVKRRSRELMKEQLAHAAVDGASATQRILKEQPSAKVFILTSFGSSADLLKAVISGATGAFLKDSPNDDLIAAIRRVATGETVIHKAIQMQLGEAGSLLSLTPRQLEILQIASNGFSTDDIARQLNISQDGIKKHFASICEKLGASNRTEAVAIAMRKMLIPQ